MLDKTDNKTEAKLITAICIYDLSLRITLKTEKRKQPTANINAGIVINSAAARKRSFSNEV